MKLDTDLDELASTRIRVRDQTRGPVLCTLTLDEWAMATGYNSRTRAYDRPARPEMVGTAWVVLDKHRTPPDSQRVLEDNLAQFSGWLRKLIERGRELRAAEDRVRGW